MKFETIKCDEYVAILHPRRLVKFKLPKNEIVPGVWKVNYTSVLLAKRSVNPANGEVTYRELKNRYNFDTNAIGHMIDILGEDLGIVTKISL